MASVEELLIKLTADNTDLKRKLGESEKQVGGFGGALRGIGTLAVAGFAVAGVAALAFGKQAFKAAEQQDQANKRLMFAVKNNVVAFKELTDQAEKLRDATGVDDAAIMQIQQLGANAGYSTDKIKKVTEAAVELAAVTGQDLQAAYMQANATFNGSAGRLTRLDAEFGTLTKTQLENGAAIDLILTKYKGFAAASATETQKLSSNWDEFTERLGTVTLPAINSFFEAVNMRFRMSSDEALNFWQKLTMPAQAYADIMRQKAAFENSGKTATTYYRNLLGVNSALSGMNELLKMGDKKGAVITNEDVKTTKEATKELSNYKSMAVQVFELFGRAKPQLLVPTLTGDISPLQSKGITQPGDGSKLQARWQNEFGAAVKKTNSELQAQMQSMQQMQSIMTGFGEAATMAFGEQSAAAKAFAVGQVIAQAAMGIMGTWAGYAEFGPVGTALAVAQTAMIGGLAITQLGNIAGAFANGGIVGGGSMTGDRMTARVNSGEMILNGRQQSELFAMANGMGGRQQVEVVGYISGDVIRLANKRSTYIADKRG